MLEAVCARFPEGITLHLTAKHPAPSKAQALSKKGRTAFEADEDLRVLNDVVFEGVFGLPGFLAWNAMPLALAYYQKDYTVEFMAE